MKQLKLQWDRLGVTQVSVIILAFGLFFGILVANIFRDKCIELLQNYEADVFFKIVSNHIDYEGLFRYVLVRNLKDFMIFWLLSITILGIPYMALKITSFGFITGFLISAVSMQYGVKGLLLILVYAFPHGLFYLPIALISLYRGFHLCRAIYHENRASLQGIIKRLRINLFLLLMLAAALLLASFLEAYPGAFLLKKVLNLFV